MDARYRIRRGGLPREGDPMANDVAPPVGTGCIDPGSLTCLPAPAAAYLRHALRPGTPVPETLRVSMHGHIRLGVWLPFQAVQEFTGESEFTWSARVAGGLLAGRDQLRGS